MKQPKSFYTYEQQLQLLKSKKLYISDDSAAIDCLKHYGYFSLISGYKDIFKIERNGNYRSDADFEYIVRLYIFDEYMRNIVLQKIVHIEKNIKSLLSYNFCELYGDSQCDYLNANNYNYIGIYQKEINAFLSIAGTIIRKPEKFPYINYSVNNYGSVPFWVLIQALTFGNVSKLYSFSKNRLQSKVARAFPYVYTEQLSSMLKLLTKFRNVCAHGERLYNYKTQNSLKDLSMHKKYRTDLSASKNDLFNLCICLKYLIVKDSFLNFVDMIVSFSDSLFDSLPAYYKNKILQAMGFPKNWKEILSDEI